MACIVLLTLSLISGNSGKAPDTTTCRYVSPASAKIREVKEAWSCEVDGDGIMLLRSSLGDQGIAFWSSKCSKRYDSISWLMAVARVLSSIMLRVRAAMLVLFQVSRVEMR